MLKFAVTAVVVAFLILAADSAARSQGWRRSVPVWTVWQAFAVGTLATGVFVALVREMIALHPGW